MERKTKQIWGLMALAVVLSACSNDEKQFMDQEPIAIAKGDGIVKGVNVTLADWVSNDAKTRTNYDVTNDGVKVTWAKGDTIGVFPNVGGQVEFPITNGTESNQAQFDGGGWALRSNSTYAAYYPYRNANGNYGNQRIQLEYTGQEQYTNGSTDHLAKYDYQATGGVKTNESGFLNFQFKHVGALLEFQLTVPKAGIYTSLTLISSEKVFVTKAELDISGESPVLKPTETSNSITLSLDGIELKTDNSELAAYMMLTPADLSKGALELSLNGSTDFHTSLTGHQLDAGMKYTIQSSFGTDTPQNDEIIVFKDANVKAICIEYFDTDGDGELSYAEAAAVTSLPVILGEKDTPYSVFASESVIGDQGIVIHSFNELQYFTSLTELSHFMFANQSELEEVTLPDNLTSISYRAFLGCTKLKSIHIPDGVLSLGAYAFGGCSNLTSINIPNGVTSLGSQTFYNCSSLTSISIPSGITTTGYGTFQGCTSLTNVQIPNSVTTIGEYTFQGCTSLTSIDIPSTVTTIKYGAFMSCSSLESIDLPNSATNIGDAVFAGCSSLKEIELPYGLTNIGNTSFRLCSNLTSINIPSSVTSIGDNAFDSCSSLTSLELPANVSTIGWGSLKNCPNLTSLTILREEPPVIQVFLYNSIGLSENCTIYVPAESVELYKNDVNWGEFASQVKAIP